MLITFNFLPKTPSLNHRTHWAIKAKQVKELKSLVKPVLIAHKPCKPFDSVKLRLMFYIPTRRRMDIDNLIARAKPLIDAMVDTGILLDDSYQVVRELTVAAEYRKGEPGLEIEIVEE